MEFPPSYSNIRWPRTKKLQKRESLIWLVWLRENFIDKIPSGWAFRVMNQSWSPNVSELLPDSMGLTFLGSCKSRLTSYFSLGDFGLGNSDFGNPLTFVIKQTLYLQKVEAPKVTLGILFWILIEHYVQVWGKN